MIDPERIGRLITSRYGLGVTVGSDAVPEGQVLRVGPVDVDRTRAFTFDVTVGWRSVEATFAPGNYAGGLVKAMRDATVDQIVVWRKFLTEAIGRNAEVSMEVNGERVDPFAEAPWQGEWRTVGFRFRKAPLVIDARDTEQQEAVVGPWVLTFFGIVAALLPLEPAEEGAIAGEVEGDVRTTTSRRYERSRINRALCLELYGPTCRACGFTFADVYGELGQDFIHVHHAESLSTMDGPRVLDPSRDLLPVCPNCHAMLHRRSPPYTIEELQCMMQAVAGNRSTG